MSAQHCLLTLKDCLIGLFPLTLGVMALVLDLISDRLKRLLL
jgi:hypothetical protein